MKRRRHSPLSALLILIVGAALLLGRAGQSPGPREPRREVPKHFAGKCTAVTDGDTIKVLYRQREEKVRLYGIDSPEKSQPYHRAAADFTARLAFRKTVSVEVRGRDRYGRVLGWVRLPDGRVLNVEIVRAGYGWWFRKLAPELEELGQAEREAQSAGRGLWKDRNPVPPWEFRKR